MESEEFDIVGSLARSGSTSGTVRSGDHDQELILDPETPMETLFAAPAIFGIAMLFGGGFYLLLSAFKVVHGQEEQCWSLVWTGAGLTAIGAFLRSNIDIHYRIDFRGRTIGLYRKLFGWETLRQTCDFSGIHTLGIDLARTTLGESANNRGTKVYEYRYGLILVLKNSRVIRLLDRQNQNFRALHLRAESIAAQLGVPLVGESQTFLWVLPWPGEPRVMLRAQPLWQAIVSGGCLLLLLWMLGGLFLGRLYGRHSSPAVQRNSEVVAKKSGDSQATNRAEMVEFLRQEKRPLDAELLEKIVTIEAGPEMWAVLLDRNFGQGKDAKPKMPETVSPSRRPRKTRTSPLS